MYPWRPWFKGLGWSGFRNDVSFIVALIVALAYCWKKGALEWESWKQTFDSDHGAWCRWRRGLRDDALGSRFWPGRRNTRLFMYPFVTACCGMEFMSVSSPRYDIFALRLEAPRFSPRQSICCGWSVPSRNAGADPERITSKWPSRNGCSRSDLRSW